MRQRPQPDPITIPEPSDFAAALARPDPVVVIDRHTSEGRGRGILAASASRATPALVNAMILQGRGLTCFAVTAERALHLGLNLSGEARPTGPVFLRSVEAADCDGTGISAADRAATLRAAGDPAAGPAALKSPGHVFPTLIRAGDTSLPAAALALLRLALGEEVAAWTDILDDEGELASAAHCAWLADQLGLPLLDPVRP